MEIESGATVVILGRSGVGKSVLLKQIIGMEYPDKGEIEIDDVVVTKMTQAERYKKIRNIGMLFQGAALFDSMTVGENTAFFLREHGDPKTGLKMTDKEMRKKASEALEMVDLAGTENKLPSDLSGGMRKRAGLARMIVYQPTIKLFDEPTTGLDPITAMQINNLIVKTQNEMQGTSIIVTHDLRSADEITRHPQDRLAFHHEGKILYYAPKEEFFKIKDPILEEFFKNATFDPNITLKRSRESNG